jgi:hypothetical protein
MVYMPLETFMAGAKEDMLISRTIEAKDVIF